jgi:hypothetical protein
MRKLIRWGAAGLLFGALLITTTAFAADPVAPCPGTEVSGTVVAVDMTTNTVTIDTGSGLCTVSIQAAEAASGQPIVKLLGQVFDRIHIAALGTTLMDTQAWLVFDSSTTTWSVGQQTDPGAVVGQLISVTPNADGTFTLLYKVEGQTDPVSIVTSDSALADRLTADLQALKVQWSLVAGAANDAGQQIAAYHADGMGFGVLVKFYSLSQKSMEGCATATPTPDTPTCGVTVQQLVDAFRSGTGIGLIFKQYGRPDFMGVGQAKQSLKDGASTEAPGVAGMPRCRANNGKGHAVEGNDPGSALCATPVPHGNPHNGK